MPEDVGSDYWGVAEPKKFERPYGYGGWPDWRRGVGYDADALDGETMLCARYHKWREGEVDYARPEGAPERAGPRLDYEVFQRLAKEGVLQKSAEAAKKKDGDGWEFVGRVF